MFIEIENVYQLINFQYIDFLNKTFKLGKHLNLTRIFTTLKLYFFYPYLDVLRSCQEPFLIIN
jgi:hypothetical protein